MKPEQFETLCECSVTASRVTETMLQLAESINPAEAARLANLPSIKWDNEPLIAEIESAIPGVKDRVIQAILVVASKQSVSAKTEPATVPPCGKG